METGISYYDTLPLKEIAMRRVAVNLWTAHHDVLASINTKTVHYNDDAYLMYGCKRIDEVRDKLSKLMVPKSLMKQMAQIFKHIGVLILKWKKMHEDYLLCTIKAPVLGKLCWTPASTVDCRKTAEELIRCKMFDARSLYLLACLYCLEECVKVCWLELPEDYKNNTFGYSNFYNDCCLPKLESCWPYILKGEESKMDRILSGAYQRPRSFNMNAFENLSRSGNKAAAEYFFRKLTREQKENSLIETVEKIVSYRSRRQFNFDFEFRSEHSPDIVCYLLSLLNREQQMEIFKKLSGKVLLCFVDWPWQDVFVKLADLIGNFTSIDDCDLLLRKIPDYWRDSTHHSKLFQEFFMRSPIEYRKSFVGRDCNVKLKRIVFDRDSETLKVIFRNIDVTDRMRLVSSKEVFSIFDKPILKGKSQLCAEVCLREATLSEEDRERLKRDFWRYLKRYRCKNIAFSFMRFLRLLKKIYPSAQSKRRLDKRTLNLAKKLSKKARRIAFSPS